MGITRYTSLAILLVLLASCNATRVIKPLEKGEKAVSAGFGGPLIAFAGAPIPIPLTSVTYSHGLDTGITLTASVHTTSLLFGVAHLDVGLGIKAYESKSKKWGITAAPGLQTMFDFDAGNARNYPQLEAIGWWQYAQKPNLLYGGLGTWVELERRKAHEQVQDNELMPWITIGQQFNRPKWSYTTEVKFLGFQHDRSNIVVDYIGPGNRGAFGAYFGISRRFGK